MKKFKLLSTSLLAVVLFASCSNSDDTPAPPVNEEEVISTLTAVFTPEGGGTAITLKTQDLDGDGPNAPVVTVSGSFIAGKTYNGNLTLLNELANPVDNITTEITQEGVDHQFFFQSSTSLGAFSYSDADANGKPIGLAFKFIAGATPFTGTLTITLRHQPNKSGANVPNGDITNAAGETDVEATFPVSVQ
ncbi:type 1 periplasmic binding fold superfamily protein [Flavobacterium sp. '19STA2R22 D10 B1']|uniref:type 1 periplasmic binding fold superfamily protein n=1 Tax=Flavobacterium aerium TaxID=3037261 RepID=UPI00278C3C4C|nr:type 1 periplasmic binding fold superfamily protein [Flavobacterium sp. '19STA2R22 D10 B1']